MAIRQFRIINTQKGILNITAENLNEVSSPTNSNARAILIGVLTQSGTDVPVLTAFENDLGITFNITRNGVGQYDIRFAGDQTGRLAVVIPNSGSNDNEQIQYRVFFDSEATETAIRINTYGTPNGLLTDGVLTNTAIEMYYYPNL